jgi:hypothetical protein
MQWEGEQGRVKGQGVETLIPIAKHDALEWVPVESVLRPSVTLHAPAVPQVGRRRCRIGPIGRLSRENRKF